MIRDTTGRTRGTVDLPGLTRVLREAHARSHDCPLLAILEAASGAHAIHALGGELPPGWTAGGDEPATSA